jgi:hypothetical protein
VTRRQALRAVLGLSAVVLAPRRLLAAAREGRVVHPTPRPGITGAKVLTAEQLAKTPQLIELFDGIRAIPQIADGIGCHCGCREFGSHYSLLTCYEGESMARSCPICQGEGRVAVRMAKAGKSLDEIRAAIDAQYG